MALDCCVLLCRLLLATDPCTSLATDRRHVWTDGLDSVTHCDDSCHVISPLVIDEMTSFFKRKMNKTCVRGVQRVPSWLILLCSQWGISWQTVSSQLDLLNFLMDMQIAMRISRIPFVPYSCHLELLGWAMHQNMIFEMRTYTVFSLGSTVIWPPSHES
jgi:hypothetical protein